jgi:hypothetical protein
MYLPGTYRCKLMSYAAILISNNTIPLPVLSTLVLVYGTLRTVLLVILLLLLIVDCCVFSRMEYEYNTEY